MKLIHCAVMVTDPSELTTSVDELYLKNAMSNNGAKAEIITPMIISFNLNIWVSLPLILQLVLHALSLYNQLSHLLRSSRVELSLPVSVTTKGSHDAALLVFNYRSPLA